MDVTGLTIGFVSLAGLYTMVIDCFKTFQGIRSFGRDHEILTTKLDVEKDLLLQWGERVGMLNTDRRHIDPRLFNKQRDEIITQVLRQIKTLLTDTDDLQDRYGLQAIQPTNTVVDTAVVSHRRMNRFTRSHDNFKRKNGTRSPSRQPNILRRLQWTIADKEKFSDLLKDLNYFVSSLNQMIPVVEQRRMMNEDLHGLIDQPQSLRLIEAATRDVHDDWSEAASSLADLSEATSSRRGSRAGSTTDSGRTNRRVVVVRRDRSRHRGDQPASQGRSSTLNNAVTMMDDVFRFGSRRA